MTNVAILPVINQVALIRRCALCSCTDAHACAGGCSWVGPTICSACAFAETSVVAAPAEPLDHAFAIRINGRWVASIGRRPRSRVVLTAWSLAGARLFVPGAGAQLRDTYLLARRSRPRADVLIFLVAIKGGYS